MQNLFTIIVASRQTHLRRRHASWRIRRAHRGLQRDGPGGSQHCRDRDSYRRLQPGIYIARQGNSVVKFVVK